MKIKELRRLKGVSQSEIADALSLTNQVISRYENNLREPDIQTLCRLSDYFQVSIDELVGHSPLSPGEVISDEELALIADYRMLDAADQDRLKKIMSALKKVADAERLSETNCV